MIAGDHGGDAAALAYAALEKAQKEKADILIIDTAGRLQNRTELMDELAKIVRVIRKLDASAPNDSVIVLDGTVGQNALSQVKAFQQAADVSGLIVTKLDGSAKGGVVVALAEEFGLPVHAVGVGEGADDLQPFDAQEFANALTGVQAVRLRRQKRCTAAAKPIDEQAGIFMQRSANQAGAMADIPIAAIACLWRLVIDWIARIPLHQTARKLPIARGICAAEVIKIQWDGRWRHQIIAIEGVFIGVAALFSNNMWV